MYKILFVATSVLLGSFAPAASHIDPADPNHHDPNLGPDGIDPADPNHHDPNLGPDGIDPADPNHHDPNLGPDGIDPADPNHHDPNLGPDGIDPADPNHHDPNLGPDGIDPADPNHHDPNLGPDGIDPADPNHHDPNLGPDGAGNGDPNGGLSSYAARVESLVRPVMARWNIPNATLAIGRDNVIVYRETIRNQNVQSGDEGIAQSPDVRGRIASLSKSITGAAILKLVEDEKLTINALAHEVLASPDPEFVVRGMDERITISHLLRHTAGFTRASGSAVRNNLQWDYEVYPEGTTNRLTVINYALEHLNEAATDPGDTYEYSNIGYLVLGEIVERLSLSEYGLTYEDYVKNNVLPANSEGIEIAHTTPDQPNQFTYTYHGNDRPIRMELRDAAGGWMASAPSLLSFLIATEYGELSSIYESQEPCAPGDNHCYRAGFSINGQIKSHSGSNPGTYSFMKLDRTNRMSCVIIFNARSTDRAFGNDVERTMTQVMRQPL